MKNIIFIAPPGAGKGTQSDLLVKKYGYVHVSTGELFRNEVALGTELGKNIEDTMNKGILISNEIVTELLRKRFSEKDVNDGFILEGYPRKIEQSLLLDNILDEFSLKIDRVIYLRTDVDVAMRRALARITCPKCNRGYNRYEEATKPKVENICDDCGSVLTSREDDNEESFKTRYNQYLNDVEKILKYYEDLGSLRVIDNSGTPEETFKKIEEVI